MKIVLILLTITISLQSQIVKSTVFITADKFDGSQLEEIKNLDQTIQSYINNKDWTSNDLQDVIDLKISIIIESIYKTNGQTAYKAQFLINSPAQENYYDKRFEFYYKKNESINTGAAEYQTIGNVIDFYVNLVLAGELDTFYEFGGEAYYSAALQSLTLGLSNQFAKSWLYREKLYNDNISPFVKSLRIAKYEYYVALNYQNEGDYLNMRKYAKKVVDNVVLAYEKQPNNLMLKQFLEGYYKRIIEIIDPELDQLYIRKMIAVDPIRRSFYEKYLKDN